MNNKTPLLEDLKLFCVVARKQSFAATALELGVSNAFVSKRIAVLEQTLGVRLLHRTTRKVALTDHGTVVHQWAQRIREDVDQLGEAISQKGAAPHGLLRLCTSSGFGRNRIAPAISKLALDYPELEVQLELLDRPVDLIAEGFQLDIRVGQVQEPHLIARRIAGNQRVLCAAPAYLARHGTPRRLGELAQHRCIAIRERDQDVGRWKLSGPEGEETVRVKGPLSTNNGELVHQWAIDGHGIILRSIWDVGRSLADGSLVRVLPAYHQQADVWAIYPDRLATSANVRVCVQFLEAWLIEHASP
ncbi:LysR family transcriptional regulator [Massilia sp. WF1]|uniref:LysR family transcriptional regulator n=1 Tax=unclassified Massilia TaxID=2609279 RepID=UPI000649E09E|nr:MULTISPECIES: LysR family transcriptional regulator [unclassified Massilia]ALK97809.1 LysR family transcriptional regulator [Massilia sp. WG5]KLU35845.1 LysR family transcriptional regulator [Massilia sp. WF1]